MVGVGENVVQVGFCRGKKVVNVTEFTIVKNWLVICRSASVQYSN